MLKKRNSFFKSLRSKGTFLLVLTLLSFAVASRAQTSTVDAAFNPALMQNAAANYSGSVLVQPDGKIIVFGRFLSAPGGSYAMRLNPDGSVDGSFNCTICVNISITNAILQPDGKLLVAGMLPGAGILRLNTDGSQDPSFNALFTVPSGTTTTPDVYGLQPDGKIIARYAANFTSGFHTDNIVRLNTNGSADTSFDDVSYGGSLFTTTFTTGLVLPDGKILAGIRPNSPFSILNLYRYNTDGTRDMTFESPSFASSGLGIYGLSLYPDGKIMVSGAFQNVNSTNRNNLVRLFPAGNVDLAFNADAGIFANSGGGKVEVQPDGKILLATAIYSSGNPNPNADNRFLRLNADGSIDNFFNPPIQLTRANNYALDSSGRVLLLGTLSGVSKYYRLNADGSLDSGFNSPILSFPGTASALAIQADGKILVGGEFHRVGGTSYGKIARINSDATADTSFNSGSGFDVAPFSIVPQADGKILALGTFTTYNGTGITRIARIKPDGSLDDPFHPDFSSSVNSVVPLANGKILVGGNFLTVNAISQGKLAILNADGSLDTNFAPLFASGFVSSVFVQTDGKIMAGGSFPSVNGFNRQNLVRLNADGTLDAAFNAGSIATVLHVTQRPDGKYLIAHAASIARRNNDGTIDAGFQAPSINGTIKTLVLQPDGSFFVSGAFSSVTGGTPENIARFAPNGALDRGFLPDGANNTVNAVARQSDGNIIVGGTFLSIANVERTGIARITVAPFNLRTNFDFDGDGKADVSVFRPSENKWYVMRSSDSGVTQQIFAILGDVPVPADYDGDGKTDIAIFRPSNSDWWSLSSFNANQVYAHWGEAGVIPSPSDFDGDGKTDYIYFLPSNSTWYRYGSSAGASYVTFGIPGDKPVTGDFDGDGKSDPAIFRPSTGDWWYAASSAGGQHRAEHWGISTDIPAPADYDGDGKTDFAVYRPSTGAWYIFNSSGVPATIMSFGISEDKPVPADYDGDGKADIAVFRPSNGAWYLLRSTDGFFALSFGISTDVPVPNAFVP